MRATANATITFGLVTFPVKVYAATAAEKTIKFKQLCGACSTPPKQQYHCEQCNTNVPRGQMSKGYEFAKGQYLVFSPEEIKDLQEESSKIIEVAEFVDADSIDPTYYSKPYYLGTDKAGSKAYAIFRAAMQNTNKIALGKFAIRGQQYLVAVRATEGGLMMHELLYADMVRDQSQAPVADATPSEDEVEMAEMLIEKLTSEVFDPSKYRDEVRERMQAAIDARLAGEAPPAVAAAPKAQALDIMAALKASLEAGKKAA